jgi:hypothetical protein
MRALDRTILIAGLLVAVVAAFWFLVLSPKREEAAKLGDDVASLESEVSQLQQVAEFAEQARREFPRDYTKVVKLGKAVPEDDDTASLFAQLSGISERAGVDFMSLALSEGAAESAAPPASPSAETTPPTGETTPPAGEAPAAEAASATAPAPTEAAAASLPIGATVGPAGLPVMPYELTFQGDFFHVADFVAGLDGTVSTRGGAVSVDGRLMTIDGFSLTPDPETGFPSLVASFAVTTYVTPPTEGLTAGASPSSPGETP